jgi:hypothetical protein
MPLITEGEDGASVRAKLNKILSLSVNPVPGPTHTVSIDDHEKLIVLAEAATVTIPSGLPADFRCKFAQAGTGEVTIVGSGTTINSFEGTLRLAGQWATADLLCIGANAFILTGDLGEELPVIISPALTTSAGVFNEDGLLVRLLWADELAHPNRNDPAAAWDGTIDDGSVAPTGDYTIKVLYHNIGYTWEGAVGNTSPDHSTVRYHAYGSCIRGMCITDGNEIYFTTVYDERIQTFRVTTTTDIQNSDTAVPPQLVRQALVATHEICTDGTRTYVGMQEGSDISGVIAVTCATKVYHVFSSGTTVGTLSWLGRRTETGYAAIIKGLAVQKTGNFIFLARPDLSGGTIHVYDKVTAAAASTFTTLPFPSKVVSNPTTITQLWVAHSTGSGALADKIVKCAVDGAGTITTTATVITGLQNVVAMAISPDGSTLLVADGGNSQQVKAYNTSDASVRSGWGTGGTLGTAGGYANSPAVTNTKFMFYAGNDMGSVGPQAFLAYQPDGKFWIGDVGNHRYLRFSSGEAPAYIDHFGYIPGFYGCRACKNDPTRVMVNSMEFHIDYNLPLSPSNGSWTLANNWLADAVAAGSSGTSYTPASHFGTYSNGRTYAAWDQPGIALRKIFELTSSGLRNTMTNVVPYLNMDDNFDGYWVNNASAGSQCVMRKNPFLGFDSNQDPSWEVMIPAPPPEGPTADIGNEFVFTSVNPLPALFTRTHGYDNNAPHPTLAPTLNNIIPFFDPNTADGYGLANNHFGGIDATTGMVKFNTHYVAPSRTGGGGKWCLFYPDLPAIPYNITYGGGPLLYKAGHEHIFTVFNGEEWGNNQTNVITHWHDSGLPIKTFGPPAPYFGAFELTHPDVAGDNIPRADPWSFLGLAGMAGNSRWGDLVFVNNKYYIYQNDEWYHGGLTRWRIDNLDSFGVNSVSVPWNSGSYVPVVDSGDLLAGLPLDTVLVEGTAGWHRTDGESGPPNTFKVFTGGISVDWRHPDLILETLNGVGGVGTLGDHAPHGIFKALPRVGSGDWTVEGEIMLHPGADEPESNPFINGNIYFEILDNTDKVIINFHAYICEQESGDDSLKGGSLQVNDVDLFPRLSSSLRTHNVVNRRQPFSIAANVAGGTIAFEYATYSTTVTGVFEVGALIGSPAKVRIAYRVEAGAEAAFREVHAALTRLRYDE